MWCGEPPLGLYFDWKCHGPPNPLGTERESTWTVEVSRLPGVSRAFELSSLVFTSTTAFSEPAVGSRVFPYELDWTTNNTVDACLNQCAAFGYPAAGLEYGEQCCKCLPSWTR